MISTCGNALRPRSIYLEITDVLWKSRTVFADDLTHVKIEY